MKNYRWSILVTIHHGEGNQQRDVLLLHKPLKPFVCVGGQFGVCRGLCVNKQCSMECLGVGDESDGLIVKAFLKSMGSKFMLLRTRNALGSHKSVLSGCRRTLSLWSALDLQRKSCIRPGVSCMNTQPDLQGIGLSVGLFSGHYGIF